MCATRSTIARHATAAEKYSSESRTLQLKLCIMTEAMYGKFHFSPRYVNRNNPASSSTFQVSPENKHQKSEQMARKAGAKSPKIRPSSVLLNTVQIQRPLIPTGLFSSKLLAAKGSAMASTYNRATTTTLLNIRIPRSQNLHPLNLLLSSSLLSASTNKPFPAFLPPPPPLSSTSTTPHPHILTQPYPRHISTGHTARPHPPFFRTRKVLDNQAISKSKQSDSSTVLASSQRLLALETPPTSYPKQT